MNHDRVFLLILAGLVLATGPAAAQDEPKKIKNLDAHLKGAASYQKADLVGRLAYIDELEDADRIGFTQRGAYRELEMLRFFNKPPLDGDPRKILEWLAKEYNDRDSKVRYTLGSKLQTYKGFYGPRLLLRDPAYLAADIPTKLRRLKELYTADLLEASFYEGEATALVWQHLHGGKDEAAAQLTRLSELEPLLKSGPKWRVRDLLAVRVFYRTRGLDTLKKKLSLLAKLTKGMRAQQLTTFAYWMVMEAFEADSAFQRLDYPAREEKIKALQKAGTIGTHMRQRLLNLYARTPF